MNSEFHTSHGSFFPKHLKFVGILFCISIVLIPLGLIMYFSEQGAGFRPNKKEYRNYVGLWGLRFGKWESYENYTDMALLSQRMTSSTYSRTNRETAQSEVVHELYLLTPDHRRKILAYVFKNKEAAEHSNPESLAEGLGVNFRAYNPQVSAQTRARRRR